MSRTFYELQDTTRAAPDGTPGTTPEGEEIGLSVSRLDGYRVTILAPDGQALGEGGTLLAYVYNRDRAVWLRAPSLDLTPTLTGVRGEVLADVHVHTDDDSRVLYAANGCATTGTAENEDEDGKIWVLLSGSEPRER